MMSYSEQSYPHRNVISSELLGSSTTNVNNITNGQYPGLPNSQPPSFNQINFQSFPTQPTKQPMYANNLTPHSSTYGGDVRDPKPVKYEELLPYGQKPQISSQSPNYVVYGSNSYSSVSSLNSQRSDISQQNFQQYQQSQQQTHQPQQQQQLQQSQQQLPQQLQQQVPPPFLGRSVLNSQFKFPDSNDSSIGLHQQTNLLDPGYNPQIIPQNTQHNVHHVHHQHAPLDYPNNSSFVQKPYIQGLAPDNLNISTNQLDQKFNELISTSKEITRKRTRRSIQSKDEEMDEFVCSFCGKAFAKNYNLKSHLKTHSDDKPFNCSYCSRSFARNHDKKRHELLHQGIKRFQCGGVLKDNVTRWGCGKRFSRADGLSRHFKTDIGWLCVRPLMLEAKQLEGNSVNEDGLDQSMAANLDINFINELVKGK